MNTTQSLLILATASAVTYLIRYIPFLFFGGKKGMPKVVRYLGNVLPPAIIATLVIFCVRHVDIFKGSRGFPEAIGIGVTVLIHLWKRNTFLSIALGTAVYMAVINFI
ncbi:MAG: AzlD domain-containing protein [Clostridiaceae bacterium]